MQSPLVTCVTTTRLQDLWGEFILNYKLTELTKNLLTKSGTSTDSTVFNHTTFSLLQTGATVPLKAIHYTVSVQTTPTMSQ
jgi:hypothetical protein